VFSTGAVTDPARREDKMKYFAILRDSLREALDSKVIYVMFGLSGLVILFVLTLTFEPASTETMLQSLTTKGAGGRDNDFRLSRAGPAISLTGFTTMRGEPDSPDAEVRASFVLSMHDKEGRKLPILDPPQAILALLKQLFAKVEESELLKIDDLRHVRPKDGHVDESPFDFPFEVDLKPAALTRRLWPHHVSLFFGAAPIGAPAPVPFVLLIVSGTVVTLGAWVSILVSVIITGFFVPNMLRKGAIDLLLVKPIHRWALLLYKYLGGLTFIFLNTAFVVLGVWLALGLRSGLWANGFLLTIFAITFYFAVLYAVSVLFAVLTESVVASILLTCGIWVLLSVIGTVYQFLEISDRESAARDVVRAIHAVVPRTSDLSTLMQDLIYRDLFSGRTADRNIRLPGAINWAESIGVSCAFIAVMLSLSCWRFATRDY
jgi:ABC-type transport system involved in multi-copper enzyme maturation permease subunit